MGWRLGMLKAVFRVLQFAKTGTRLCTVTLVICGGLGGDPKP